MSARQNLACGISLVSMSVPAWTIRSPITSVGLYPSSGDYFDYQPSLSGKTNRKGQESRSEDLC